MTVRPKHRQGHDSEPSSENRGSPAGDDGHAGADAVPFVVDGVLDLHTFQAREVKSLVHDYLDECRRLGIHEVRIIHGKGTGKLRELVHAQLRKRTDVTSFRLAPAERGGWGATLVDLER